MTNDFLEGLKEDVNILGIPRYLALHAIHAPGKLFVKKNTPPLSPKESEIYTSLIGSLLFAICTTTFLFMSQNRRSSYKFIDYLCTHDKLRTLLTAITAVSFMSYDPNSKDSRKGGFKEGRVVGAAAIDFTKALLVGCVLGLAYMMVLKVSNKLLINKIMNPANKKQKFKNFLFGICNFLDRSIASILLIGATAAAIEVQKTDIGKYNENVELGDPLYIKRYAQSLYL